MIFVIKISLKHPKIVMFDIFKFVWPASRLAEIGFYSGAGTFLPRLSMKYLPYLFRILVQILEHNQEVSKLFSSKNSELNGTTLLLPFSKTCSCSRQEWRDERSLPELPDRHQAHHGLHAVVFDYGFLSLLQHPLFSKHRPSLARCFL